MQRRILVRGPILNFHVHYLSPEFSYLFVIFHLDQLVLVSQGVDFVVQIRILLLLFNYLLVFDFGLDVCVSFILQLLLLLLFLLHINII